jgi:hypothetical protein
VQLDLDSNPPVIGYHLNGESFGPGTLYFPYTSCLPAAHGSTLEGIGVL